MYFYINFDPLLGGGPPLRGCAGGGGAATCGGMGILHFGVRMVILLCVYAYSAQVAVKRPRDSHLSDLSQVTLQVPLGSCTGDFICGGDLDPNSPTRRRWLEGNFAPRRTKGLKPHAADPHKTQKCKTNAKQMQNKCTKHKTAK